ncbi:hypothetical protein BAE44_0005730 [Dichanthelium oligosanthes]|uniref:KIB1-4 beta-propeller domain-containing protein n=1 Tax=Dichanthelium oligosanthes TaxID=888268 RepID=A0A1E5W776_9POAL|nr:hypothetical protein BAE44_0005730 [Dichanthelium oligosanthes]
MRGNVVVLGSSGGWLFTADARGQLRMANPITGDQADLPAITTIPFLRWKESARSFLVDLEPFLQMRRFYGLLPLDGRKATASSLPAEQFCNLFYRKVVLSAPPRSGGGYAAMLILGREYGAPAFATAEDPAWRLAPFYDAVDDAIYHRGRFYSISYSGVLESWDRHGDTGEFTSKVVNLKSTGEHPGLRAGCVYFTNDQLGQAYLDWDLLRRYDFIKSGYVRELRDRDVGVFSLRDGTVEKVEGTGMHPFWPLPAWFTPSFS